MNYDISITIDRIITYRISNKISRCQLNGKKDCMHVILFICMEMAKHLKRDVKRKNGSLFVKLVLFSNVLFKQTVTNKSPCVAYHQKRLLLQFAKIRKSISSKLRPQDVIKKVHKKHPVLRTYVKN